MPGPTQDRRTRGDKRERRASSRRKSGGPDADRVRSVLAQEAAKYIAEGAMGDFHAAKLKAAEKLGLGNAGGLPTNAEIEAAITAHQRLFHGEAHRQHVRTLREAALIELVRLNAYGPRLVGTVLSGTANATALIELHVFFEPSEQVGEFLESQLGSIQSGARRHKFAGGDRADFPSYVYTASGNDIEVVVFPYRMRAQPPLDPVNQRAMSRASLEHVRELLSADDTPDA